MRRIGMAFLLSASILVAGAAPAAAEPRTVDCGAGDSLQAAIDIADSETPLEVFGVCQEHVVITVPLTIIGGDDSAVIDGSGQVGSAVTIESDSVFIRNLTIRGASSSGIAWDDTGHGVYDAGAHAFSLLGVTVEANDGAGILMYDSYLTISHSRVRDNGSTGIALLGGCCGIIGADWVRVNRNGGGGIYTAGDQTLVLTNSKVKRNIGGGISADEDAYIADSVIRFNPSGGVSTGGTGRIVRARIVDNGGYGISDALEVFDSVVARNSSGGIQNPGIVEGSQINRNGGPGIWCTSCEVTRSTIRRNAGPGVHAKSAEIVETTIAHNQDGGIVATSDVTIDRSLISRNVGEATGAVLVDYATVEIINSTVRRNSAADGAAIRVRLGVLTVTNSTIFANSGRAGVFANSGSATVAGSIVHAHNGAASDCTGDAIISGGYNVAMAPGCAWTATDVIANPDLLPLADNGGPTRTHALGAASPAIDAVPAALCQVAVDQRGEPRPAGPGCDSGAFEGQ